jgi:hypothetical protein
MTPGPFDIETFRYHTEEQQCQHSTPTHTIVDVTDGGSGWQGRPVCSYHGGICTTTYFMFKSTSLQCASVEPPIKATDVTCTAAQTIIRSQSPRPINLVLVTILESQVLVARPGRTRSLLLDLLWRHCAEGPSPATVGPHKVTSHDRITSRRDGHETHGNRQGEVIYRKTRPLALLLCRQQRTIDHSHFGLYLALKICPAMTDDTLAQPLIPISTARFPSSGVLL